MTPGRRLFAAKELALGLAAGCLLDLLLVFATSSGAGAFCGGFLAGGALDGLALGLVGDALGVCHVSMSSLWNEICVGGEESVPQRLKPDSCHRLNGTAKAVPYRYVAVLRTLRPEF